jgi:demethylmenaquinone methyltransferase/2-methoxy-6-polyprenyl-1,4-benzoquinol methylase
MARVMKKGGRLLILESAQPSNPVIRLFYRLYLRLILIPLGGILSGNWKAYAYLAGSSAGFYSFAELVEIMNHVGFGLEMDRKFLFGAANLLVATKRD